MSNREVKKGDRIAFRAIDELAGTKFTPIGDVIGFGEEVRKKYPVECAEAPDDMILVKLALEKGADIHVNNNEPLKVAVKNGHFNIIKFLVENGANVQDDVLGSAIWGGNLDIVKYLVNHGADVHERNDLTLAWASSSGNLNIVKYLLDHGVDIHANDDMAISWASSQGHLNVVKYLVSRGANIHTPGTLYHAHLKNQSEVVDYLISQGAKRYKKYFY